MKLSAVILAGLMLAAPALAQKTSADTPATKEDVQRYLETLHTREMMRTMLDTITKQMHELTHQQVVANEGKLPPDFESRMNRIMDAMIKEMPIDEMLDAMVPVYQKHLTKGDIDALVAFYSTPTGQKMLRDLPAIMAEAMQACMPIMQEQMTTMQERLRTELAATLKDSPDKPKSDRP